MEFAISHNFLGGIFMAIELNINGKKAESLLRTNVKTSDIFKAYADTEYEKKRKNNHKKLLEEIDRQNLNDYGV